MSSCLKLVTLATLSLAICQCIADELPWCENVAASISDTSDIGALLTESESIVEAEKEFEQVHVSLDKFNSDSNSWSASISWAQAVDKVYFDSQSELDIAYNHSKKYVSAYVPAVLLSLNEDSLGSVVNVEKTNNGCVFLVYGASVQYKHSRDDRDSGNFADESNRFYLSPKIFHAYVPFLEPETQYYYRVGKAVKHSDNLNGTFRSDTFSFVTPPAVGTVPQVVQNSLGTPAMVVTVIGDIGQTKHSLHTRDSVLSDLKNPDVIAPSFAVILGDLSYADGAQHRWDTFGNAMESLFSSLPLMVLPGNHEIELDQSNGDTFRAYKSRYRMPGDYSISNTVPATNVEPNNWEDYSMQIRYDGGSSYYSFEVGLCHFVVLNTYDTNSANVDTKNGTVSLQQLFLESDLAQVNREITPFVIVMMHAPFYNSNKRHKGEVATEAMQGWAEPILYKYNVDLVFAGHVHSYERTSGVRYGVRDQNSTVFINVGNGGNHEELYDEWEPAPPYRQFHDGRYYGHGSLEVFNYTHLRWIWKPNPNIAVGEEPDVAWIRGGPRSTVGEGNPEVSDETVESSSPLGKSHHIFIFTYLALLACFVLGVSVLSWKPVKRVKFSLYDDNNLKLTGEELGGEETIHLSNYSSNHNYESGADLAIT